MHDLEFMFGSNSMHICSDVDSEAIFFTHFRSI